MTYDCHFSCAGLGMCDSDDIAYGATRVLAQSSPQAVHTNLKFRGQRRWRKH